MAENERKGGAPRRRDGKGPDKKRPFRRREGGEGPAPERREFKEKRTTSRDRDSREPKEEGGQKKFERKKTDGDRPFRKRDDKRESRPPRKESYKEKRSFTRNKKLRRSEEGEGKVKFEREKYDRGLPFKRKYPAGNREDRDDKTKRGDERGERPERREWKNPGESKFKARKPFEGGKFKRDRTDDDRKYKPRKFERPDDDTRKPGDSDEIKSAPKPESKKSTGVAPGSEDLIRLNKYLSNAGIASRREADKLIQSGAVKVNGEVVNQLGHKIKPTDKVTYGDTKVKGERKVYLLLNKPKDYITTVDDPQERKTVMELIRGACSERVYPVGRLDRNTSGVLLFTNDGELTKKLTHPKYGIKKVYQVTLNRALKPDDFRSITEGVELEDGQVVADDVAFVGEGRKEIGIEIHTGRNRVVRRLFEHLGYDVIKLDRVVFAGLTKKDLPRGKFRFLTPKEIGFLQMIG